MRQKQAEPEVDLRVWGAYVVGHHPQTLRLWQRSLLRDIQYNGTRGEDSSWRPIATEIEELEEALRVLALAEQLRPAMQVELHRALDKFEAICRELPDWPEPIDADDWTGPGYREWRDMVKFSGRVVGPSEDLDLWAQLGAAVGKCQHSLAAEPAADMDHVPAEVKTITELMGKLDLSGQAALLKEATATARKLALPARRKSIDGCLERAEGRFLEVSHLDDRLRAALQNRPATEPWLVLHRDTITLLGEQRPLAECGKAEAATLWVLAENAGTAVSRKTIIREGKLQTDELNLKFTVSRLRKVLLDLVQKSCRRRGCDDPPGSQDGFIPRGKKGTFYNTGPYTLALPPGRVKIAGPRPDWMRKGDGP